MVLAALICFVVLLLAWVLAPDETTARESVDNHLGEPEPVAA